MSHVIEISDEIYQQLEKLATRQGQSPQAVVEHLIALAEISDGSHHYYELDDWLRRLGFTDEEIAAADVEVAAESDDANA